MSHAAYRIEVIHYIHDTGWSRKGHTLMRSASRGWEQCASTWPNEDLMDVEFATLDIESGPPQRAVNFKNNKRRRNREYWKTDQRKRRIKGEVMTLKMTRELRPPTSGETNKKCFTRIEKSSNRFYRYLNILELFEIQLATLSGSGFFILLVVFFGGFLAWIRHHYWWFSLADGV